MKNIKKILPAKELRKPIIIAWSLAILIGASVPFITGQIYGSEQAKDLLESVQKASLYYGSAITASSATILALMLTLLSLTNGRDKKSNKSTYIRLKSIASHCVLAFLGSIILLLFASFPVTDFDKIPLTWYEYVYYVICFWNGILAGQIISTILILRDTVTNMIADISPDFDEDGDEK